MHPCDAAHHLIAGRILAVVVCQVVAGTAMPEEYRNMVVSVLCNDCHARSEVRFHVVGHKCGSCGSYNTRRV